MAARGHQVFVVGPGKAPDWFALHADYVQTQGLEPHELPPADVTVATFWTTLPAAKRAAEQGALGAGGARGEIIHFCQGFEAELTHNQAEHPAILEAYETNVPAMAVSPHLAAIVAERFHRPARVVPQPLGSDWRPARRWRPRRPPRILITGPWEIYLKGVPVALKAVLTLRQKGVDARIVRLSQWPLCEEERALVEPDEFHHHLSPEEVPALTRSCDLLLAPSWSQEGFGLPVLEAMAAGVPSVVSDIPSFRAFATGSSELVPFDRADLFADRAQDLLENPAKWRSLRRRGLREARRFSEAVAAEVIEETLRWAADGSWRDERLVESGRNRQDSTEQVSQDERHGERP